MTDRAETGTQTQGDPTLTTPFHAEAYTGPAPHSRWTVAVDLAASQDGDGGGARNQRSRLQELATQSRNNDVSIVVQVTEPAPSQPGDTHRKKGDPKPANVERFLIQNGSVTALGAIAPSRGMANDVTDLLRSANQVAPSDNLGLIVQSHGGASDGLEGDSGKATLSEFTHAVTEGLAGSGHSRLDLLDFDSCSMGNLNVAESVAPIADHMIASSETESAGKHAEYDGQNIQASIANLIAHPTMSAGDFARSMITQADAGTNDGFNRESNRVESGTSTLAHFDLTHIAEFNTSLGEFGNRLAAAAKDPAQRRAIDSAIESAPLLPRTGFEISGNPRETRDLLSFTNNILNLNPNTNPENGLINSDVRRSAEAMRDAMRRLIPEYHGSQEDGYDRQGGMTAFLPDLRLLNPNNRDAEENLELAGMQRMSAQDNDYSRRFDRRSRTADSFSNSLEDMRHLMGATHKDDLEHLQSDVQAVRTAPDKASYDMAMDRLHADTQQLSQSEFGRDLLRAANSRTRDRQYSEQAVSVTGWQNFLSELKAGR